MEYNDYINFVFKKIKLSNLDNKIKEEYLNKIGIVSTEFPEKTFAPENCKLTKMDMKYIICFVIEMKVTDIAKLFNVEKASVYTARYRIKKKFKASDNLSIWYIN